MAKANYEDMKIEIEEFKKKLIDYFNEQSYDITLSQLFKNLKLDLENLDFLQYCLDELVKEGLIKKSPSLDHYQYDRVGGFIE